MTDASYTEKHIHAISVVEADRSILGRESALRRILHVLQANAIDLGEGRGTTHVPEGQRLAEVAQCKPRNARASMVRLRQTRWLVDAIVPAADGSIHSGFLVALRYGQGFGTEVLSEKIRDPYAEESEIGRQYSGNIAARKRQLSGNVGGKEAAKGRQGSGNVGSAPDTPKQCSGKSDPSLEFNNITYVSNGQTSMGFDERSPRKPLKGANGKPSTLMTLHPDRRDEFLALAEILSEHDVRRYSEHPRSANALPRVAEDPTRIAEALFHLEKISRPESDAELVQRSRSIIEFRWGEAKASNKWGKDQWDYWFKLWTAENMDWAWKSLMDVNKSALNEKYHYRGLGKDAKESEMLSRQRKVEEEGSGNPDSEYIGNKIAFIEFHEMVGRND